MIEAIAWTMLICNGDILLLKRPTKNNHFEYSLVGGHVEKDESVLNAAIRETSEEIGVFLNPVDLTLQHVIDRKQGASHKIHFFFLVSGSQCNRNPYNKEPEKHLEIKWINLKNLPLEIGPLANSAIKSLENHNYYSLYGWD